jgi:hypothetical protein
MSRSSRWSLPSVSSTITFRQWTGTDRPMCGRTHFKQNKDIGPTRLFNLLTETASSAETSVTTYQITRHDIRKDSNLHIWPSSDLLIYDTLDEGVSSTEWKIKWTGRGVERQRDVLSWCLHTSTFPSTLV